MRSLKYMSLNWSMGFEPADGLEAFGIDLNLLMILVQIYKGVRNLKMPKTWRTCSVDRRCGSIGT